MHTPDTLLASFEARLHSCPFMALEPIERLAFRDTPYWYRLSVGRHIGIHRPDARICNWTARILTSDKRYVQKCLGPALETGRGVVSMTVAVERAAAWFCDPDVDTISHRTRPVGRADRLSICPVGDVYTIGHALRDYFDWSRLARSPGGHYNNLVLANYHLVENFSHIDLESFDARDLADLARQVLDTPPRFGFEERHRSRRQCTLTPDEVRRRKRTFNSLVSLLRVAFRLAWDNGAIETSRPLRCLRRIDVVHSPRRIFLSREECRRLLAHCTPALHKLVLAGLYTGCRVGELGALRVEDVAFQVYGVRIAAFKRSPARFVFLPDEGMAFFLACCEGKSPRDYVFTSEKGHPWRKQHCGLFRRAVAQAGLPKDFVFHGLRHTYASELVRHGVPLDVVARQLGHANTATVVNTYGHLAEHFREDQIRDKFPPLVDAHRAAAQTQHQYLANLRRSLSPADWRDYGKLSGVSSRPRVAYARPHQTVQAVFEEYERGG